MPHESLFENWLAEPAVDREGAIEPTNASLPILVVGAGPAGLAAMAALARAGVDFVGVERHERPGGIWDVSNPASSVYGGMRTVTSRYTSHLGQSMPSDWPEFVPHERVHEYLLGFSRDEHLTSRIRCRTAFVGAEKPSSRNWQVKLQDVEHDRLERQEFRAIIFATGAFNQSTLNYPQKLRDEALACGIQAIHSSEYKDPADFAGKRVLVVGIGNSGSDIATKVSEVAQRTLIAVRTDPWINPQTAFGVPCDKLAADAPAWLPEWYRLGLFHFVRRLKVGSHKRLGLTKPSHALNDRLPVTDRGIVDAVRSGRIAMRSNASGFRDGNAHFTDSAHPAEPIDAVIFATGFVRNYPLLCAAGATVNEVADALSFLIFHRSEPGLAYMAETVGLRGCWPVFVEQARAIAAYYAAEASDASRVRRFNARRSLASPDFKGTLFRGADRFHVDYNLYQGALRELAAWLSEDAAAAASEAPASRE